jgi:tetratricopeptide (TPR) repeat protein
VPPHGTVGYAGLVAATAVDHAAIGSRLEAAEALRRAGRLSEARDLFLQAAQAAEAADDGTSLVTAVLGAGGIWVHEQRDWVDLAMAQFLWQRAEELVVPGSVAAARLATRRAAEATYEGEPVEFVEAAVERVRSLKDDVATAEALSLLHHAQLGPRFAETRLGVAEEMLSIAARAGDQLLTLVGLCWRTVDLFLLGDPRGVQSLQELRERSAAEECEAITFIAEVLGAMTVARAGRFEEAESAATRAADRGAAAGDPDAPAYYGAMLAVLRWWEGRGSEVLEAVRSLSISPRLGLNDHVYVAADALLSASTGDLDGAEDALARLNGIGLERLPHSSTWLSTQFLVAETAYVLGDAQTAVSVGTLLSTYAHLPVMPSLAVVCLGSAERSLGLAAATAGETDAAIHHLDAALRADHRLGNRPMAAVTEHDLAAVIRARGREGDVARSEALGRRAADRAQRLGMELRAPPEWLRAGVATERAVRRTHEVLLQPCLGGWRIVVDGRATLYANQVGFGYLAELVSRPGEECHVLDLATSGRLLSHLADHVTDDRAIEVYRRRAKQLTDLLDDDDLSPVIAEQYREELVGLAAAVTSAIGLGGRLRRFPDNDERARTAVRKALMRAVDRVEVTEPELAQHLRSSLVTGVACRYSPGLGWNLRTEQRA